MKNSSMKLRCTTDSIRIRIRRSELDQFNQKGKVADAVRFPDGQTLHFSLEQAAVDHLKADFTDGHIRVMIPKASAKTWGTTEQVGLEETLQSPGSSSGLHLLIEKDFPCLHRTHEDKADTFTELAPDQ